MFTYSFKQQNHVLRHKTVVNNDSAVKLPNAHLSHHTNRPSKEYRHD